MNELLNHPRGCLKNRTASKCVPPSAIRTLDSAHFHNFDFFHSILLRFSNSSISMAIEMSYSSKHILALTKIDAELLELDHDNKDPRK